MPFNLSRNSQNSLTRFLWDDLRSPESSLRTGAQAPDIITFFGSGNLRGYGFNGTNTTEMLEGSVQFPHGWNLGSNIRPHIHWMPTTAAAGNVKWQLEYSWQKINSVFAAPTTISTIDATAEAAWTHQVIGFSEIDGSGITSLSSMMKFRIFRDPTDDEDTYAADAAFLEFDIHVQIEDLGSVNEYSG